jgi:hypothetical protein
MPSYQSHHAHALPRVCRALARARLLVLSEGGGSGRLYYTAYKPYLSRCFMGYNTITAQAALRGEPRRTQRRAARRPGPSPLPYRVATRLETEGSSRSGARHTSSVSYQFCIESHALCAPC